MAVFSPVEGAISTVRVAVPEDGRDGCPICREANMQSTEVEMVVNADDMDDRTFRLHFSRRHSDNLGGLSELPDDMTPETTELYRKFHDRIHSLLSMEMPHQHREN